MEREEPIGDNTLSSLDLQMWSIHLHILARYKTQTMFKYTPPHVPHDIRGLLIWYVPNTSTYYDTIVRFLEFELDEFREEDREVRFENEIVKYPGTIVQILPCSPIRGYIPREYLEAMVRDSMQNFIGGLLEAPPKDEEDDEEDE
jgi:hypothetical protein